MAKRDTVLRDFHEDKNESETGRAAKWKVMGRLSSLKSTPDTQDESHSTRDDKVSKTKKKGSS
jgi:hypothetical protein